MIQMVFTSIEECQNCLNQININKNLIPPACFDTVHEWFNINHPDYIAGGRASIMKPTGGASHEFWLHNCEQYNYTLKEEDSTWYEKVFPPEEEPEFP